MTGFVFLDINMAAINIHFVLCVFIFGCFVQWCPVESLRVDGSFVTNDDWVFLTRFCYMSKNGKLHYYIIFPNSYANQQLLFYYDRKNIWDSVYGSQKTCAQRKAVLDASMGQVLTLSPLYSNSGCKYITVDNVQYIECETTQKFSSSRDMWWYLVIARCPDVAHDPNIKGLNVTFRYHMVNGEDGDIWYEEFSADELFILPTNIGFIILYCGVTCLTFIFALILRSRQMLHTTYKMFIVSVIFWWFHLLLWCIAHGKYSQTGYKEIGTERAARIFAALSSIVMMLMLLLMAHGYTIVKGKLTSLVTIQLSVFFTFYIVSYAALFIVEANTFDPGKVLYIYEYWPGYALIALRLLAWVFFVILLFITLKKHRSRALFYYPLFIIYTLWFWAGPIAVIIAMYAIRPWAREKIVNGVEQLIMTFAHLMFLILTRPQAANKNFPYTIRTSQIGLINEDSEERQNQYALSDEETQNMKGGPDLNSIFTTSYSYAEPSAPPRSTEQKPFRSSGGSNMESESTSTSACDSDNDNPPPTYSSLDLRHTANPPAPLAPISHFITDSTSPMQRNNALPPINPGATRNNALPPIAHKDT